jgi:hypothetical protein
MSSDFIGICYALAYRPGFTFADMQGEAAAEFGIRRVSSALKVTPVMSLTWKAIWRDPPASSGTHLASESRHSTVVRCFVAEGR